MSRRQLPALAFALVASSAMAQEAKRTELVIRLTQPDSRATWRVAKVSRTGEIALAFDGSGDARTFGVEGYSFLVPKGEAKALVRVMVTAVEEKAALVKTSVEAAKLVAEGDAVLLVPPLDEAQMKNVPDRLILSDSGGEATKIVKALRDTASRARSGYNLREMGLAMHNYFSANKHLPPAIVRGPDGKPWHSWRVMILPFIDQQELYDRYDFSQPWDSPKNLKLLDNMPDVYRDPIYGDTKGHFTNYAVLVGETTPFPPDGMTIKDAQTRELKPEGAIGFGHIQDGTSNTFAIVPVSPGRKIPWTKPEDIAFDEDFPALGDPSGIALPNKVNGAAIAPVLMMDGSVNTLWSTTKPVAVKALATRAGGEMIGADALDPLGAPSESATLTIVIEGGKATATIR